MITDQTSKTASSTARAAPSAAARHNRRPVWGVLALVLAIAANACASDESGSAASAFADQGAVVLVANAPGTITTDGPQRVLVALLGDGPNEFLGTASQPVTIEFVPPGDGDASSSLGTFLSTNGAALGLYVTSFEFDQTGQWGVRLAGDSGEGSAGFVQVVDESVVPAVGQPAPASVSPTAGGAEDLAGITTDPEPNPDFYTLSIDEAIANGRPTAIAFATPAFCQTALCGPTVEMVKQVALDHPEVDFVHVEPFDLEQARAGSLVPTDVMLEWELPTEPWIFVVGSDGVITATFEGIIGQDELDAALRAL